MKKNQLIISVLAVIAIGFSVLYAKNEESWRSADSTAVPADVTSSTGALTVTQAFHDFDTISMANGKVSHVFKITNSGAADVKIKRIYTSCMCTTATLTTREGVVGPFGMPGHTAIPIISQLIIPNEEASIEVTFDPAAHGPEGAGKARRIVYVETDAQKEIFELVLEANVTL